ncbi:hypothetical protein BGZ81_002952, partial [Podila clonocystis]
MPQEPPVPFEDLDILEESPIQPNLLFPEIVFAAAEAGPRAGDVDVAGLQVGTDLQGRPQYFRDPDLLHKAFPNLYPFARGGFSLWHHKTNQRNEEQRELPVFSLKDYVKYRLFHFDRHFAKDARFICFVNDWITKDATFGHFMRSTTARRRMMATTGADILQ